MKTSNLISMKNIIYFLYILAIGFSACKKDDDDSNSRGNNNPICLADLVDKTWIPDETLIFADLFFKSDGTYYEDGRYDGTWELSQDCSTIKYTTITNGYYEYEIIYISNDSLRVNVTLFGPNSWTAP